MPSQHIFRFKTDLSEVHIPENLNNPFSQAIPQIAQLAAIDFQEFILTESQKWGYDFNAQKGKMFGVLVVQQPDASFGFLGAVSGKLPENAICKQLVPSVFDETTESYRFKKGMLELTEMSNTIKQTTNLFHKTELIENRKNKSIALQQWLFKNYVFSNFFGDEMTVFNIFNKHAHTKPPAAAGECAAPKLLQYAIKNQLKPIALMEFWWGKATKNQENIHLTTYPACKNKCQPILEFMLSNAELFKNRQ